jgi:hypothetical protein
MYNLWPLICDGLAYSANAAYIEAKERSKELLDVSKAKLDDVDDELRRTFQAMEEVCHSGPFIIYKLPC